MSLRQVGEAEDDFIMPCIRCAKRPGTSISNCQQRSTKEQSTISRSCNQFVQKELGHNDVDVKRFITSSAPGREGCRAIHGPAYNRKTLQDDIKTLNLLEKIETIAQGLCSLLLQPTPQLGSRDLTRPRSVDAVRDVESDLIAAAADSKEQNTHVQMAEEISDPAVRDYPMTAGHHEIQAIQDAVREVSTASLSLRNAISDLHNNSWTTLPETFETRLYNNLDFFCWNISQLPDRLTTLILLRKTELDAIKTEKDAAADTVRAAAKKMAEADAREKELVVEAEAFEQNKKMTHRKMVEALELLRAVKTREKVVAGRERRAVNLEEEQVLEELLDVGANAAMGDEAEAVATAARESGGSTSSSELLFPPLETVLDEDRSCEPMKPEEELALEEFNLGADAALEDAAEAAAAAAAAASNSDFSTILDAVFPTATENELIETAANTAIRPEEAQAFKALNRDVRAEVARMNGHSAIRSKTYTAAVDKSMPPSDLETRSITSCEEVALSGRYSAALREEKLWNREVIVASREKQNRTRERLCTDREELLERTKAAMILLVEKEKAQIDTWYTELVVEDQTVDLNFKELIDVKRNLEKTQARVRNLIGVAAGLVKDINWDKGVGGGN